MNNILKKMSIKNIISFAAALLGIVGLILFCFANKTANELTVLCYIVGLLGVLCSILIVFFDYKNLISITHPAFYFAAFFLGIYPNIMQFMLQFNGVAQGEGAMGAPNGAFWAFAILQIVAGVACIVANFLDDKKGTHGA